MAKQGGLGCQLFVSGYDLGDDIQQFSSASPIGVHDLTPITKRAMVRKLGQRDGSINSTAFFNPSDGSLPQDPVGAHKRFGALPTTDQLISVLVGTTIGFPAVSLLGKQLNYDGTRAQDGMFTFATQQQGNGFGLEWGRQLTAGKRTDSAGTNGASYDYGAASAGAYGLQAYLHVFKFTGTSATVKIQSSSDDGGSDAFADIAGASFAAVTTGPGFQRIATAAIAIERYLRVVTTGTFSELVFAVMVNRNEAATVF